MRRSAPLIEVVVLAVLLAGVALGSLRLPVPRAPVTTTGALHVAAACNMGYGLTLPAAYGSGPSTTLPNGDLLQSVELPIDQGSTALNYTSIRLIAITPNCTIDRAFAGGGTVDITVPKPDTVQGQTYSSDVTDLTATPDGGVLLGANNGHQWLIARIDRAGRLVTSFGHGGWTNFVPYAFSAAAMIPPWIDAIALERNGSILVAGDAGEPHCCTINEIYRLTPRGSIDTTFGSLGHAHIPPDDFGFVDDLFVQSDGSIVVSSWSGDAGCGYDDFKVFSAAGVLERGRSATWDSNLAFNYRNFSASSELPDKTGTLVADLTSGPCTNNGDPFTSFVQLARVGLGGELIAKSTVALAAPTSPSSVDLLVTTKDAVSVIYSDVESGRFVIHQLLAEGRRDPSLRRSWNVSTFTVNRLDSIQSASVVSNATRRVSYVIVAGNSFEHVVRISSQ